MNKLNPMDVAACTCANLRRATRVVTQVYDAALKPVGLRATQFNLLAALEKRGGVAMTPLAEALVMDRTTLTRNLKPLIARGLVRVEQEQEQDQRVRRIHLTGDGMRLFHRARPHWQQVQARLVEGLGGARWAGFLDDLSVTAGVARGE